MKKKVESALEKIRPMLQMDGGDIELVGIEGNTVKVKLRGACHGCPMSQMTLQHGVEKAIKEAVPQIEKVVSVAD
ncbi:MAG: NifU family protein [Candidatus Altiarchaeota archaeon]